MIQSTQPYPKATHVAIIMDGNGRWAAGRGLSRSAGHRAGAEAARRTLEAAAALGIPTLTLFAFSSDNWQRPPSEVGSLMFLLERYLEDESRALAEAGVRLNVIGRRDRLQPALGRAIERAETVTCAGSKMLVRVAIDYSARHAIALASRLPARRGVDPEADFARRLERVMHSKPGTAPVDLVIRSSGEQRLSDFMLWESAYAELFFLPVLWPEFDRSHLEDALRAFGRRDRRFGSLEAVAS